MRSDELQGDEAGSQQAGGNLLHMFWLSLPRFHALQAPQPGSARCQTNIHQHAFTLTYPLLLRSANDKRGSLTVSA